MKKLSDFNKELPSKVVYVEETDVSRSFDEIDEILKQNRELKNENEELSHKFKVIEEEYPQIVQNIDDILSFY